MQQDESLISLRNGGIEYAMAELSMTSTRDA